MADHGGMSDYPELMHAALDTTDCRGLAEFYRALLGLRYRPGDEPPVDGSVDDADWLVLTGHDGRRVLAVQQVDELQPATWPAHDVPMQLHLDFRVPDREALERHRARAESLGGRVLLDRTEADEASYVIADPAGHPFCLLVGGRIRY